MQTHKASSPSNRNGVTTVHLHAKTTISPLSSLACKCTSNESGKKTAWASVLCEMNGSKSSVEDFCRVLKLLCFNALEWNPWCESPRADKAPWARNYVIKLIILITITTESHFVSVSTRSRAGNDSNADGWYKCAFTGKDTRGWDWAPFRFHSAVSYSIILVLNLVSENSKTQLCGFLSYADMCPTDKGI